MTIATCITKAFKYKHTNKLASWTFKWFLY